MWRIVRWYQKCMSYRNTPRVLEDDALQIKNNCNIFNYFPLIVNIIISLYGNNGYQIVYGTWYCNLHLSYWSCSISRENETDSFHLLLYELIWITVLRDTSCVFLNGVMPVKFSMDGTGSCQPNIHLILPYLLYVCIQIVCWIDRRIRWSVHFICYLFISKCIFVFLRSKVFLFLRSYFLLYTVFNADLFYPVPWGIVWYSKKIFLSKDTDVGWGASITDIMT